MHITMDAVHTEEVVIPIGVITEAVVEGATRIDSRISKDRNRTHRRRGHTAITHLEQIPT